MSIKLSLSLILGFSSFILLNTCFAETSQPLSTITDAKVKERVNPKYPRDLARLGIEGWTRASYIVETDGTVSNVIITDSSGTPAFNRQTIKAFKKWTVTPAQENGQAVQQCHNNIQLNFSMKDGGAGVSRKFLSKYRTAKAALVNKDFETTQQALVALKKVKQRRLAEHVYLKLLQADYAKAIGDKKLQLSSLTGLDLDNKKFISPTQKLSILHQKFILKTQLQYYKSALSTYKKLEKLKLATTDNNA